MTHTPVFRFAPSPNGLFHLGHAYSALVTFDMAQRMNGRFLLRLEDIDIGRCREEYAHAMQEDLTWLGIEWKKPVRRQSQHFQDYARAIEQLESMGLLYPCFASRAEIRRMAIERYGPTPPRDPDGAILYPGTHKYLDTQQIAARKAKGEPFALRPRYGRGTCPSRCLIGQSPHIQGMGGR